MRNDTYTTSDGRVVTRVTLVGCEGDIPFVALWTEGHGLIGDRVIGKYVIHEEGRARAWGEMFGSPDTWKSLPHPEDVATRNV